jgi:hypothetical protein
LPQAEKLPYAVVHENAPTEAWWKHPASAKLLASEYVKFLAVWVRSRIGQDPAGIAAEPPARRPGAVRVADERPSR